MTTSDAAVRTQGRREAAPAAATVLVVLARARIRQRVAGMGAARASLVDLARTRRTRTASHHRSPACAPPARVSFDRAWRRLVLLGLLAVGNFVALGILVAGLVTAEHRRSQRRRAPAYRVCRSTPRTSWSSASSSGRSRLAGLSARRDAHAREAADFRFPQDEAAKEAVEAAGVGLPLRLADELDRVQSYRHDAALAACESAHGARVVRLGDHGSSRRGTCRERARFVEDVPALRSAS